LFNRRLVLPVAVLSAIAIMLPAHAAPSGQATLSARTAPAANSLGWRITDPLPSGVHVSSVVATAPANAWALGSCSNRSGGLWLTTAPWIGSKVVVLHYSDGEWRRAAAPAGLSSVAWIPRTTSVWAAASGGIAKYGP
jgi:hypothetical protein